MKKPFQLFNCLVRIKKKNNTFSERTKKWRLVKITSILIGLAGIMLSSCSNDGYSDSVNNDATIANKKEAYLIDFAKILSKAIYDHKDVRMFLKNESLKQFDKNYDVLYYLIKDEKIGEKSFRDILISYSSMEAIEEIEKNVPLLNVYVSKIALFDVYPENLDTEDNEIPVVVSRKTETTIYLNGEEELSLEKGDVPNFHVFVVNENSRVVVPNNGSNGVRKCATKSIMFKSPNYDGTLNDNTQAAQKAATADISAVGQKAIDAFTYFFKNDGSINQKAFQRDYVYYGITPTNQTGSLNYAVSEYISFIEINPTSYFSMSDQRINTIYNNDPYINCYKTSQEKRQLTEAELLDRMWTEGAYNFRFEIMTSTEEQAQIVYVPLKPDQIWNFNINCTRTHPTWFRHTKYTYKIDPNAFTSKRVFLGKQVSLGKWNISEEALFRHIKIYEEDESADITEVDQYDMTRALQVNFNGNGKVGVGLKSVNAEGGFSAEVQSTTTEKITKTLTTVRKQGSDLLGKVKIYFYDPLVEEVSATQNTCTMHTYNTGIVEFGIAVK